VLRSAVRVHGPMSTTAMLIARRSEGGRRPAGYDSKHSLSVDLHHGMNLALQ
jgi:hypothetical protein